MKRKRIECFLYNNIISFIFVFVILLSCCYLSKFPKLEYVVEMSTLLFISILIIFYLLNLEVSKICLILILYCTGLFISSLLSDSATISLFFKTYFKIIGLSFYLDYGLKYYKNSIIRAFYYAYSILTIINFCTLIIYPNGLYITDLYKNNWFFNYDNSHIFMYIPNLMFMYVYRTIRGEKFKIFDYIMFFMLRNRLDFASYFSKVILPEAFYTIIITLFFYKLLVRINLRLKKAKEAE